jgi:hypothetical protein
MARTEESPSSCRAALATALKDHLHRWIDLAAERLDAEEDSASEVRQSLSTIVENLIQALAAARVEESAAEPLTVLGANAHEVITGLRIVERSLHARFSRSPV